MVSEGNMAPTYGMCNIVNDPCRFQQSNYSITSGATIHLALGDDGPCLTGKLPFEVIESNDPIPRDQWTPCRQFITRSMRVLRLQLATFTREVQFGSRDVTPVFDFQR